MNLTKTTLNLTNAITEAIATEFGAAAKGATFGVTRSAEASFGDFSCNAALILTK